MRVVISSLEGNRQRLDGGSMFGNAPRELWKKWLPPDDKGRIELACRALLVQAGPYNVLLETGIGAFFEPKLAERYGVEPPDRHVLLDSLAQHGLKHEDIDFVILSHLHFDHAGGLLPSYQEMQTGNTELLFSKARYIVGADAWNRATNPHPRDRASYVGSIAEKLQASKRLDIVQRYQTSIPDQSDLPFEFLYSDGHTPGQMHTLVRGPTNSILFCGDAIPGRHWLHTPITMGYDRFPELLIDEKKKLTTRALEERWLLFFTHDPDFCASLCSLDERERLQAEELIKQLDKLEL